MKQQEHIPHQFTSLSEAHAAFQLPNPQHPLISLIDHTRYPVDTAKAPPQHMLSFYKISYKRNLSGSVKYGQSNYDFNEGGLMFAAPGQIIGESKTEILDAGYTMLIFPDFLLSYPLASRIRQFGFFSYSANEALHLSDKESGTITAIFENIGEELNSRIDDFSQDVIISQIELLLNYANRFYRRQFITRKVVNNNLLQEVEQILESYFSNRQALISGIPSVQYVADQVNMSASYLSDLLRSLTGQNAQQHIHQVLIVKAKAKLSSTQLSVSEIAYELGFEHSQSFNRLFKAKTNLSPLEFRRSFN